MPDAGSMLGGFALGGFGGAAGAGLGGGKKGAPPMPDFTGAATASQSNPFASSSWSQGPDGKWAQSTQFTGPYADAAQGYGRQLASGAQRGLDNGQQARQHAEDAIYKQEQSRLDPQWNLRQQQMASQLAGEGLDPTSEAYTTQMDTFNRGRNDAYSSAMNNAIMGGGQEASRQQQMDMNAQQMPLQQLMGMKGLTGQAQNPLLQAFALQGQYGMDAANMNQQMLGDLGQGAGSFAMMAPFLM